MFHGVIVDDKITWSKHISALKANMARYMGVMYKIKKFLLICARLKILELDTIMMYIYISI